MVETGQLIFLLKHKLILKKVFSQKLLISIDLSILYDFDLPLIIGGLLEGFFSSWVPMYVFFRRTFYLCPNVLLFQMSVPKLCKM